MARRPKQAIHAKTTRRQNRFFGDLTPQDIARHDCKLADLRRADAVNDISLEATARRLATIFPQEVDLGPYITVVKAFLDRPANTIHKLKGRSTRQQRHQVALRLLKAITIEGETREDYCRRTGLDTGDASRMLDHLCSKDQELRCAIELIGAHSTATSSQNRQPDVPTPYTIGVGKVAGIDALEPVVRLAIKTRQGLKVLVFPNAKHFESVDSTGTSCDFRQPTVPAGYVIGEGRYPAATFTAQVGDCTWTLLCRDKPPKDWQGIEGVFAPGNETVTVGIGDDPWPELHTRGGSVSKGTFTSGTLATGGGDTIPHSEIGQQRPGNRWLRVGPRAVIEAHKGGDKLQANTTTPPTFSATSCSCARCTGASQLKWRVAYVDIWQRAKYQQQYQLVETPQLPARGHDCQSLHIRREARFRHRINRWVPVPGPQRKAPRIAIADPRNILRPWRCASRKPWSTPTLTEVLGLWSTPSLVELGPPPQRKRTAWKVVNEEYVDRNPMTEEQTRGKPLADGHDHGLKHQPSLLFQNPGEMAAAEQRLARMSSWHWWIATNNAAELKPQTT